MARGADQRRRRRRRRRAGQRGPSREAGTAATPRGVCGASATKAGKGRRQGRAIGHSSTASSTPRLRRTLLIDTLTTASFPPQTPNRPDVSDALDLVLESDEYSEERLEIFRNVFEELSLHFHTYRRLLCVIRKEYELAIHYHAKMNNAAHGGDSKSLFSTGFVERLQSELKKQVARVETQKARMTELDDHCQR